VTGPSDETLELFRLIDDQARWFMEIEGSEHWRRVAEAPPTEESQDCALGVVAKSNAAKRLSSKVRAKDDG
jgi:hypothetical protein